MKGLDALLRLLVLVIVVWLIVPVLWQWLGPVIPLVGGLLAGVVVIRVLLGRGLKP